LQRTTRITLFRNSRRIDIRNEISQNFSATFQWAFSFELDSPEVHHEEVGAIIRARLTSGGGHYATENARYDWLTLNHFADMSGDDGAGVTLSNADCYYMKLGNSTDDVLDVNTPQIWPLLGGQVDGTGLGIQNQGGDSYFLQRFALQTHTGYDPAVAMRFALEHQNPLLTAEVTGGNIYPETAYSLLAIDNPNILLWALKPADDGIAEGVLARVWNVSGSTADFALSCTNGDISSAQTATHIETPTGNAIISNGALTASLNSQQLKSFLLELPAIPGDPPATPTPGPSPTAGPSPTPTAGPPTATPTATPLPPELDEHIYLPAIVNGSEPGLNVHCQH
jgi:alpha-mannosidase